MAPRTTHLLFLALLLVYSSRAVSGDWRPITSPRPEAALVNFIKEESGARLTVKINGFNSRKIALGEKEYFVPVLENSYPMLHEGCPDLPKIYATLQLPVAGTYKPVIISSEFSEYDVPEVPPSAGNISRNNGSLNLLHGPVYSQDAFYPGDLYESLTPYISRNMRCQVIEIYPFQYNPVTGKLRVYHEMVISLERDMDAGENVLSVSDQRILSFPGISSPVLNPSPSVTYKSGASPGEAGRMLIITPSAYRDALHPFIQWKTQCGIQVEVRSSEDLQDAAAIAQYVREYYYSTGNLGYLLLVGDAEQVPTYMYPYGASDNYYSYIAGNDHYPDILVGRFSAATLQDVEIQVQRTIAYEKEVTIQDSWQGNVTGIGSSLSPGDDGEADYEHIRNLINQLRDFTYTASNEFFDGSRGDPDQDGDPTPQQVAKAINDGTGLILYAGHGSTSSWATGGISRSAVSMLTNRGKYPFIWSAACETGNFAGNTCLAEAWLRAADENGEPIGAVAALMASGTQTTHPPMEGQDAMVDQLTKAGEPGMLNTYGGISAAGMYRMNNIYGNAGYMTTDTWVLFGDPSLNVRTASPQMITGKFPDNYGMGRLTYSFTTDLINGTATLTAGGEIMGSSLITAGSNQILLNREPDSDTLLLTLISFNKVPFIKKIQVIKGTTAVSYKSPVNHSHRVPISTGFEWTSTEGGKPAHYRLYMGTDNPPSNLYNGVTVVDPFFRPAIPLSYHTTYYWRVDAVNQYGSSTGRVQEFSTIIAPDEDFEKGYKKDTRWISDGSQEWNIDSGSPFQGSYSIRSGNISHGDHSSLIFPCDVTECDFTGFWFKVESEPGNDKLQFLIDEVLIAEWSGSHEWTYYMCPVQPGVHTLEWRYTKDAQTSASSDAAWLDDISLPIHSSMSLDAGTDSYVCEGGLFTPGAVADNYSFLTWTTSGDGQYTDVNLMQPEYMPGPNDITNGEITLILTAGSYDGCPSLSSELNLAVELLPVITLPEDTLAATGSYVELNGATEGGASYHWLPGNEITPAIVIDQQVQDRGSRSVTLQVTSYSGCVAEKTIRVHFGDDSELPALNIYPNPCSTTFHLESENGPALLKRVSLINAEGKSVWVAEETIEIITGKSFHIPELPAATYYLVMENAAGRTVKPLVVR